MSPVDLLRRQHAELRTLLQRLRESSAHNLEIALDAFCEALRVHGRVEEEHLYPLLERFAYPEVRRSLESHQALRHAARDVAGVSAVGPQLKAELDLLGAQLEQHIGDEETAVLPLVEERVPADVRDQVGYAMLETVAEIENENWIGTERAWTNHSLSA